MSYILDALKKAAEQRSGPPPEVRRLLSAAPVAAVSASRYVTIGVAAAGAIALAAVVWMWAPAHDVPAPLSHDVPASTVKPVASLIAAPTLGERQQERPRVAADDRPRVPLTAIDSRRDAARPPADDGRGGAAQARVAETGPAQTTPLGAVVPAPAPPVVAVLPSTPAPAALRTDVAKLKVEVIVYSEQRPLRWAFINGRKYVEGDAIGDGAHIEEIQANGVVLVEDGRRVTVRP